MLRAAEEALLLEKVEDLGDEAGSAGQPSGPEQSSNMPAPSGATDAISDALKQLGLGPGANRAAIR